MTRSERASRRGFSLVEILICTGLAMVLATIAIDAFHRITQVVQRSQARLRMHTSAQLLFARLHLDLAAVQQTCAFVAGCGFVPGGTDDGNVRLIFMRGKESNSEFGTLDTSLRNSDLIWQQVVWNRTTQSIRIATGSGTRSFTSGSFTPPGATNYNGRLIQTVAKSRRVLNTADPIGSSTDGLDDNVIFPSGVNHRTSLASVDDIGDFTDLERNLVPVVSMVTDLSWEIVCHDGTTAVIDDSAPDVHVYQGVWLDGRMAPTLTADPTFATSPMPQRPRLLRLRLTLADPPTRTTCTFSFSFQLPGLSADG